MCSWCWAFKPTWQKILTNLPQNLIVDYLLGGLAPDNDIPMSLETRKLVMDNWRTLKGFGFKGLSNSKSGQNKGHFNQFQELLFQQENGGNPIIPFDEIVNTSKASFAAIESLKEGKWISIN